MRIILLANVKDLGNKNDILEVNDGYAINFLIPQKKAIECNDNDANLIASTKAKEDKESEEKKTFNKKRIVLKRRFFDFIISYQKLEDIMFQVSIEDLVDETIIKKLEHSSMFELLDSFLNHIKKTNSYSCSGYNKEKICNEFKILFDGIKRNEIIHELTISLHKGIFFANTYEEKEENVLKETRKICENLRNISKIMKLLYSLKGAYYSYFPNGKRRNIEPPNKAISHTKYNQDYNTFLAKYGPDEKGLSKKLNTFVALDYYELISMYNFIHLGLRRLIETVNEKESFWTVKEMEQFLTKKDLGECAKYLEKLSRRDIKLNFYLEKIHDFFARIKEIYTNRNYWIHYFSVDYYRKYDVYFVDDSEPKRKFKVLNQIKSCYAYSLCFEDELYDLVETILD